MITEGKIIEALGRNLTTTFGIDGALKNAIIMDQASAILKLLRGEKEVEHEITALPFITSAPEVKSHFNEMDKKGWKLITAVAKFDQIIYFWATKTI